MRDNPWTKGTVIRTLFVALEIIALIVISIITFLNSGESEWGYWGAVAIVFITLSPIFVYVIASAVFNCFHLNMVLRQRHTDESIQKYCKISTAYLFWGIITGALYGAILIPIFLLENVFLFNEYKKELAKIKNT